jgi:hypothetical protein
MEKYKMPVFENSQVLEDVLYNFFLEIAEHKDIATKLLNHKVILRFNYTDPDLSITIDCSNGEHPEVYVNNTEIQPEIELWMNADTAHKFWLGKVNLVMAITKRDIVVKGSVPKLLMLLPAITPAYKIYPDYLKRKGFDNYLV